MLKQRDEQKSIRVAVYIRVSTDEQAQYGFSIEAQKEKCSAFVTSQDWQTYNVYVDDCSGKNIKRPILQNLLQDAEEKKFDMVLVYKLDRFSRRLSDLVSLGEKFEQLGIGIKSVTEPFDTTTPAGKLMFNMLGSFAQFERELIGERSKMGCMKRLKEGKWNTTAPFGYDLNDGKLVLNPTEASFVRRAKDLFLMNNLGIKAIAKRLNQEDNITKRKGRWSKNSVWNLLTNPVHIGIVRWGGETCKGSHQPILSKEEFDEIQARLHEKDNTPPNLNLSPNFLLGILKCGRCGSSLTTQKGKKKYHYYACVGRDKGCDLGYLRTDAIQKAVIDDIREIAKRDDVIQRYVDEYKKSSINKVADSKRKELSLKKRLDSYNKKKDKRVKWLLDNLPERRVTNEISKEIEGYLDEIEKLRRELSDTEDYLNNLRIEEINIEIMADFLRRFVEYFEKMETGQRRLLIQAIVKEAIVYGHEDIRLRLALPIFKDGDTPPNGNGNGGDRGFPPNGEIPPQNKKGNLSASSYPFYPNWLPRLDSNQGHAGYK